MPEHALLFTLCADCIIFLLLLIVGRVLHFIDRMRF